MNPYRAKSKKNQDSLVAAKERMRKHFNGPDVAPVRPLQPYATGRPTSYDILKKRVEFVRKLPEKELNRLVERRDLPKVLGFEHADSTQKNRAVNTILVTAGKRQFRHKNTLNAMKELYQTGSIRKNARARDGSPIHMLAMAGILEIKYLGGGKTRVIIKDKKRLRRIIDEERIIW